MAHERVLIKDHVRALYVLREKIRWGGKAIEFLQMNKRTFTGIS